jgi:hypothetical protein
MRCIRKILDQQAVTHNYLMLPKPKDSMKTKVNELMSNLPEMAFLIFSIRLALMGASIGDSLALVAITAYIGYKQFLNKAKQEHTDEIKLRIEELEKTVTALKMDKIVQRGGQPHEQKSKKFF